MKENHKKFIESCPYCHGKPELRSSKEVYQKDFGNIWLCPECRAYVGCHRNGDVPKGFLANTEMRHLRKIAHSLFDPIWKNKEMSRSSAYKRMAEYLGIELNSAHISQINKEQLEKLIKGLRIRVAKKNELNQYYESIH